MKQKTLVLLQVMVPAKGPMLKAAALKQLRLQLVQMLDLDYSMRHHTVESAYHHPGHVPYHGWVVPSHLVHDHGNPNGPDHPLGRAYCPSFLQLYMEFAQSAE